MEDSQIYDDLISVLYVDDEPSLLEIGKLYLERAEGISVTAVGTPEEAIRMIKDGGYEAIVSDYQMPGMDGISFLKYIRSTYGDMPFLLFTGKGREEIVIEALNNGADYYVEKAGAPEPQFTDLVHKIRRAVSRCRTEKVLRNTYDKLRFSSEQLALYSEELNIREEKIVEIEEALRKSEHLYEAIFSNTGSATAILEEDMTISLANDAFADLAGYSREEIEGCIKWPQFVHPDDFFRLREYHKARRLDPGSAPLNYEFRFVNRSGTERVIYMTIGLIPGTLRSVASHTDITELKKTRESLSLFGNILDDSQNEIYLFDATTLRFIQVNRGGQENLGYTTDELLAITPVDLKPEYTEESFRKLIAPLLSGEEDIVRFTTIHRRKDGSEYPVEVHLNLSRVVTPPVFVAIIFDITDRLRAEEENRILRHMVDNASSAITIHDFEGKFIYVNERTLAMHGYTRDEFMGLRLEDLDVPESVARIDTHLKEAIEMGETIFEAEHYRSDGTTLPVLVHLSVAQWGDRTVLLSIAEDITGWRVIETALRKSRKQLSFALKGANDGLWDWNIQSNETYFSPRYLQMLGYTAEEFATNYETWWEYVHPDDRLDLESSLQEAISSQKAYSHEFRMLKKDGSYLWIIARGRVMETDGTGCPVRMVGTHSDISERKEVEEALRKSKGQLEYALNAANECLWEWDMVTGNTKMTRQYQRMLGYESGEFPITHAAWWEYVHPDDRGGMRSALDKAVAMKGVYSHEFRMLKKDGSYLWVLARGRVIEWDDAGNPVRISGAHIDISDRKQTEEALRLANRKLQLLSGITRHDILNQAMALNGYLALAEDQNTTPAIREYLHKTHQAGISIERTIAFTREYEQLGRNEPRWVPLRKAAVDVLYCNDLDVTFSCDTVSVYADPLLEKVFYNLMDNVLRHGQGATMVSISCVPVYGGGLHIVWEDNGEGVPDDLKEKIFDRKYGKNTGMGLFLTREILSITGITICECGTEGQGARFELAVPAGGWKEMDSD